MTQLALSSARPGRRLGIAVILAGALVSTMAPLVRPTVAVHAPQMQAAAVA